MWSSHHATDWINTLEKIVFPRFGHRPLADIETPDVLDILRELEARGTFEIRARVLQRIRAVFSFAIGSGRARLNPAAGIGREVLAPTPKVKHFPALDDDEMPQFLRDFSAYKSIAKASPIVIAATRLLMLTFVRTGEVRGAQWCEFDLTAGMWSIPAERMKAGELHTVPLSTQAIDTLKALQPLTGHLQHLLIEVLGYKGRMTGHGFRTVASTYLNNLGRIRPDMIEVQLAHSEKNQVRGAYNRADYMAYRKAMMQFWGDTLDAMQAGDSLPKWGDYEPHDLDYRSAQVIPLRA
jgi:integrase